MCTLTNKNSKKIKKKKKNKIKKKMKMKNNFLNVSIREEIVKSYEQHEEQIL